jgi:hypothetical protein
MLCYHYAMRYAKYAGFITAPDAIIIRACLRHVMLCYSYAIHAILCYSYAMLCYAMLCWRYVMQEQACWRYATRGAALC